MFMKFYSLGDNLILLNVINLISSILILELFYEIIINSLTRYLQNILSYTTLNWGTCVNFEADKKLVR